MDAKSEQSLLNLICKVGAGLPTEQMADITSLVVAGERGVAFENLCTQLNEYEIPVTREHLAELRRLGSMMGISPRYWERLTVG